MTGGKISWTLVARAMISSEVSPQFSRSGAVGCCMYVPIQSRLPAYYSTHRKGLTTNLNVFPRGIHNGTWDGGVVMPCASCRYMMPYSNQVPESFSTRPEP